MTLFLTFFDKNNKKENLSFLHQDCRPFLHQDCRPKIGVELKGLKLSEFSSNIVTYIGGRVSRKLCEKLSCPGCKSELLSKAKIAENCKLLTRKDAGGLIYPSRSVVRVCTEAEKQIRFVYGRAGHSVPHKRNLQVLLQRSVIENTQHLALFVDSVDDMEHTCVSGFGNGHALNLIRLVVNSYINIRLYVAAKSFTEKVRGRNIRFTSNKNVLFSHQ